MTKFIELIDIENYHVLLNVNQIVSICEENDSNKEFDYSGITLKNGKEFEVIQRIQEIKQLIEQANQENPYRTK